MLRESCDDAITGVLPFIFPDEHGLIMPVTLAAYFDESERPNQGGDPISVGGYVFRPNAYRDFDRKWRKMLRTAPGGGIPFMHMTDLYNGWGHFKRPIHQRVAMLRTACELIIGHAMAGVMVIFNQDEFEKVAPDHWPKFMGSIYSGSCQMCLQLTGYWMRRHSVRLPIHYFFETGHDFEHEAHDVLKDTWRNEESRSLSQYHGHTFIDKRKACGLQAADIYAWLGTKYAAGASTSAAALPFLEVLRSIVTDTDRFTVNYFTGELLRRFMDQQVTGINAKSERGDLLMADTGPHIRRFRRTGKVK